ncbi:MAG: HAD-IA family hydrolase, partial [Phyllobacteriaceae bacterium]|nr:HAD-IA family hydrolase [Phyllobacteriaceae bacterium]
SLPVMYLAYRQFLERFDRVPSEAEFASLNGPPLPEVVRRLKASHALPGDEQHLFDIYEETIDEIYVAVKPCLGADELLNAARRQKCGVGIVTSNSRRRALSWLNGTGLSTWIDFIVAGEDVVHGKPHPEPYLAASRKVSCALSAIVAIEDSPQGARSAVAAGVRTLVVTQGQHTDWPEGATPIRSLLQAADMLW